MACSCGSGGTKYEVTRPDGTVERNLSQLDAAALARRTGGSYKVQN